jgi:hypothetical protein
MAARLQQFFVVVHRRVRHPFGRLSGRGKSSDRSLVRGDERVEVPSFAESFSNINTEGTISGRTGFVAMIDKQPSCDDVVEPALCCRLTGSSSALRLVTA